MAKKPNNKQSETPRTRPAAKTLRVRPVQGFTTKDPVSGEPLPERGDRVPNNRFWQRRVRTGVVELVDE